MKHDPKIQQFLTRREQWERIYPQWYIDRHFTLYDGEMEALIALARKATK